MNLDEPVDTPSLSTRIGRIAGLFGLVVGGVMIVLGMNAFFGTSPNPELGGISIMLGVLIVAASIAMDSNSHEPDEIKNQEPHA